MRMTESSPHGFSRVSFSKMRARPNSLADAWLRRGAAQCGHMVSRLANELLRHAGLMRQNASLDMLFCVRSKACKAVCTADGAE